MVLCMTTETDRTERTTTPEFLTLPEAADQLRVQVRTLRGWIAQGELLAARPGKAYLIPRSEVERLLRPRRAARVAR